MENKDTKSNELNSDLTPKSTSEKSDSVIIDSEHQVPNLKLDIDAINHKSIDSGNQHAEDDSNVSKDDIAIVDSTSGSVTINLPTKSPNDIYSIDPQSSKSLGDLIVNHSPLINNVLLEPVVNPLLIEYRNFVRSTLVCPSERTEAYAIAGIAHEAGQINGDWKRYLRNDYQHDAINSKIKLHLGSLLWYIFALADQLDLEMEQILRDNMEYVKQLHTENRLRTDHHQ